MLNNKSLFITGGTGSFGKAFLSYVIKKKYKLKRLIIFSRDEFKQDELKKKYDPQKYKFIRYFIGDVRDKDRLSFALEDIDYILMFENLQEDFDEMCRNLKSKWGITINKKLLWDNKTKAQRNTLKKTLINLINSTPAIEEKIKKIYEKDFILYEKALTIKNPIKVNE